MLCVEKIHLIDWKLTRIREVNVTNPRGCTTDIYLKLAQEGV